MSAITTCECWNKTKIICFVIDRKPFVVCGFWCLVISYNTINIQTYFRCSRFYKHKLHFLLKSLDLHCIFFYSCIIYFVPVLVFFRFWGCLFVVRKGYGFYIWHAWVTVRFRVCLLKILCNGWSLESNGLWRLRIFSYFSFYIIISRWVVPCDGSLAVSLCLSRLDRKIIG